MGRVWRYTEVGKVDDKPVKADPFLDALNEELDSVARKLDRLVRRAQTVTVTVGTGETTVKHGLGRIPTRVIPVAKGDARIWVTKKDATAAYLKASASVDADVYFEWEA